MTTVVPPVEPKIPALLAAPKPTAPVLCRVANKPPAVVAAVWNVQHIQVQFI